MNKLGKRYVSKYGVFSGPHFPVFGPVFGLNTGKYGPENTPCLDTFHAVKVSKRNKQSPNHRQKIVLNLYE